MRLPWRRRTDDGATTLLVSGGFVSFAEPISRMIGFNRYRANKLLFDGRQLSGAVEDPIVDAEAKKAALAEARDAIEDVIEPYLMQQGFVMRTPRGRVAAPKAYERLGKKPPPIQPSTGALFGEE